MKTYCKNVDITDFDTVRPFVEKYMRGDSKRPAKWKRSDYQKLLARLSDVSISEVVDAVTNKVEEKLNLFIDCLTQEVIRQFRLDKFELEPMVFFQLYDGISGK